MRLSLMLCLICLAPLRAQEAPPPNSAEERATMETAKKVTPAVVSLKVVVPNYDTGVKQERSGVGSGVIIDPQGHVLTNFHVAGRASKIIVTMDSGEKIGAKLVGGDAYTDLAVIKLNLDELKSTNLTWASMGDSDQVETGQSVLAMGSPLGLKRTATKGIVSNNKRFFSGRMRLPTGERTGSFNTWIQTDAPINPGNSGGPLVNNRGEIIGINSRGAPSRDGLGFAVPINVAKSVIKGILSDGRVVRSFVGVELQPMEDFAKFFGTEHDRGVLVGSVVTNSPADKGGLRTGDVLLRWGKTDTNARFEGDVPSVRRLMAETPPGTDVKVLVLRDGKEESLTVRTKELENEIGLEAECPEWRCTLRVMTRFLALERKLPMVMGVLVMGVDDAGPAHRAKLRVGDVITKFDGQPIGRMDDFLTRYRKSVEAKKKSVLLTVRRGKAAFLLVVQNDEKEEK